MKSILVILFCFALAPLALMAEKTDTKKGDGKKKNAQGTHQGQGQGHGQGHGQGQGHVQGQGQGQGQGGKHAGKGNKMSKQGGMGNGAQGTGEHGLHADHGAKTLQKGEGNLSKGHENLHTAQGKVQVKHFDNLSSSRHTNIESIKFHENYRIAGAEAWRGERYTVFRSYHSVWHDHGWWAGRYNRIVLIGGGWYYLNAGFWYPAWGYAPAQAYYPYDGPIYAYNNLPPDQVIANVQEALQGQGYYHGDVDGLLGPQTRAAIADYQSDHGLYTTSAIDEPTLSSLGFT